MTISVTLNFGKPNQLAQDTSDGRPDENYLWNCGLAEMGGVVSYTLGISLSPDEMHDLAWKTLHRPPETTGLMGASDIATVLASRFDIPATVYSVPDRPTAMKYIRQYLSPDDPKPLLVLRSFNAPHTTPWHWNSVIGWTGPDMTHCDFVMTEDPWGGFYRTEDRDGFWNWMADNYPTTGYSCLVGVDRSRDAYLGSGLAV